MSISNVGAFKRWFYRFVLFGLGMGLSLLLVLAILAEFGDHWWIADLVSHFRFQYIAFGLGLAGIAGLLKRLWLGVAALGACVPHIIVVLAVPVTASHEGKHQSNRVRISTVNLKIGEADPTTYIQRMDADVVSLQEVTPTTFPRIVELSRQLPYIAPPDWRDHSYGVVLISRYPLENIRFVRAPWMPVVEATVRTHFGRYRVIVVHPQSPIDEYNYNLHSQYFRAWVRQATVSSLPLIVVGDFNLTPWSFRLRSVVTSLNLSFAGDYLMWPRTWPAHPSPPHNVPLYLFGGIPIDHVLVSPHFESGRAVRGPYIGSDHYPVTVDLFLKQQ
jgi:endonuclease/exonuclease/phosphatase (EEP) superfamily protein YafD